MAVHKPSVPARAFVILKDDVFDWGVETSAKDRFVAERQRFDVDMFAERQGAYSGPKRVRIAVYRPGGAS